MAFQKWQFKYTPPPTLVEDPTQTLAAPAAGQTAYPVGDIPPEGQRATSMIAYLQDLRDTAAYLERVIDPVVRGTVVPIDLKANPPLEQAFRRLYQTDKPPQVIDYEMYQALVGTEDNLNRAEIELTNMKERGEATNRWSVSPIQKMDAHTIMDAYENGCIETAAFAPNLSLVYRELKGDQLILDTAIDAMRIYTSVAPQGVSATAAPAQVSVPKTVEDARSKYDVFQSRTASATTAAGPSGPNVIKPLSELKLLAGSSTNSAAAYESNSGDNPTQVVPPGEMPVTDLPADYYKDLQMSFEPFGQRYGAVYDIAAGIDCVYSDIANLIEAFIANPVKTLAEIITALKMLKMLFMKTKLKDMRNALAIVVLPLLVGMAFRMLGFIDGLIQKAIDPLRNGLQDIYKRIFDVMNLGRNLTSAISGSRACQRTDLTGLIKNAAIQGAYRQAASWVDWSSLNRVTKGLDVARNALNWAVEEPARKRVETQRQIIKMIDKRTAITGDRLEVLSSMRSTDALINVLSSVAKEIQMQKAPASVMTNAIKQASGWNMSDNKVSQAQKADVNRIINGITCTPDVTVTPTSNSNTSKATDITQAGSSSAQQITVTKAPVPTPPENVQTTLLRVGAEYLDAPNIITVTAPDLTGALIGDQQQSA